MEIARNPSDDNLKQWFDYIRKKNELSSRLQARMQEYLAKNQPSSDIGIQSSYKEPSLKVDRLRRVAKNVEIDPKRFRLRMYFESTCPHCRRMLGVLKRFSDQGYEVQALQIDDGPVPIAEKIVPILKADRRDLKAHGIKGVPFLLIADTKRKALLPAIEGYHEYSEIVEMLEGVSSL